MFHRQIKLPSSGSYFLFGPRGTGKTTLLKNTYPDKTLYIDLLEAVEEDIFSRNPMELDNRLKAIPKSVRQIVIDEIQKVPKLLDAVHRLIESTNLRFILTGSSGRKLRRGASNLLAGRASVRHLSTLTHIETADAFNLDEALQWGTLPKVFQLKTSVRKADFLRAYALTYLNEEIRAEQIIRLLNPFRQFLEIAAQSNGKIINFTKIGDDTGIDTKTVQSYFTVLEDTLIGFFLQPYHASVRKRQRTNPKFYFFDTGVKRALDRTLTIELKPGTYAYGSAFEHYLITEIHRLSSYADNDWQMFYLQTNTGTEIDLVIDRPGIKKAILEIKSTDKVTKRDVNVLSGFTKDMSPCEAYCLSRDRKAKKIGRVWCLHWQEGIKELGL